VSEATVLRIAKPNRMTTLEQSEGAEPLTPLVIRSLGVRGVH